MMKLGGKMPECPECHNHGRHKTNCPRKRKNSPRSSMAGTRGEVFVERFREKIKEAADGVLASCIAACLEEAEARRVRIEEEARERLRALDAVLPPRPKPQAATPTPGGVPTHEAQPAPGAIQCGAVCPDDHRIACTQPRMHEGQHRNHIHKRIWQRRVA